MVKEINFDWVAMSGSFSSGLVEVKSLTAFPLNAATKARYQLSFTLAHPLGAGGLIKVTFP
jgi:hypothetical protein